MDFNAQVRPLLSKHCLVCHGPDEDERAAGLRLDTEAGSREDLGGYAAIVPGAPGESELLLRLTTEDEGMRMPPAEHGRRLSDAEIELLRQWIDQGADFARHWSYVPPTRPDVPKVRQDGWPRNAIDHFVLARLEAKGLEPESEADRLTLARRVSLDLIGVPPTWEAAAAFATDERPHAYQRFVDKLLADPRFGERWARVWLDLARYADSAGYADDPPRTIWAYRDYVIDSLNASKPFDEFTVEQIAGDLLPEPTEEQLIATAFHRNTKTNNEGGTNDEEFRNVAVVDRVNTTMAAWMGTTMACAQCHTHKYDPITQEEYFQFFAFFNNTQDADKKDERPVLELWSEKQRDQRRKLRRQIDKVDARLAKREAEAGTGQAADVQAVAGNDAAVSAAPTQQDAIEKAGASDRKQRRSGSAEATDDSGNDERPADPLKRRRDRLAKQLASIKPVTTVPILRQLDGEKQRTTRVQIRGNYRSTAQQVSEGTPSVFHPLKSDSSPDRLDLAAWLVDDQNPLTPRVVANRHWEKLFGRGIVLTSEDFGSQGDLPTHPMLLDWLAIELRESGWDLKKLVREIVTSAAYRQSSIVTEQKLAADPNNQWLSRGPRFRISAEMVRDQALLVGGLLSSRMHGPSVNPPQPKLGLKAAFGSATDWTTSEGANRYRRGLYTSWRRSNPYPSMAAFDAPNREVCLVRRSRTNTPLQALVTLNDPVYVEAARGLATRMIRRGDTPRARLIEGFRIVLIRNPSELELERLERLFLATRERFRSRPEQAKQLTDGLPESPRSVSDEAFASWTVVANVLLNLDELFLKR